MKLLITKRLTALLWALVLTLMPMSLMADNTPLSVTVTFEVGSFVHEQAGNAFDGKPETKWCGGILTNNTNAYVQVQLAEKSKLDYYYLYTGNDINYKDDDSQQQRNPKEWKLYAKVNEGDEWTLISHVTDAGLPTTVCTRSNNYKIDAAYQNIEYNYLKFEILQVEQGTIFEVGEICFINCNHTFGSDDICTECGYKKQQDDGFINVATTKQLWDAIKANDRAKVRLTADFALSDIDKDNETFFETFYGTIDGNGHTIKGDPVADIRSRTYMFTNCDGATIKNLTFKGIRIDNRENHNQAVIASQAKNGCVFENITFDHISTYVGDKHDNTGAVAGYATTNCTFKNITVKNSDFTANRNQAGCVVGHARNCTFENIKVEHCESTSRDEKSGGVAGRTDDCTINNVEILGTFIKTDGKYGGGVVGYSEGTHFTNCVVDDQSCVCVDGIVFESADAGGIVGYCKNCKINNCINSALVAADLDYAGGIVGDCNGSDIEGCLNTGMVFDINMDDVINDFYNKYKTKTGLTCVTKTYQGKKYVIRKYDGNYSTPAHRYFGGIVGEMSGGSVSKCVNFGSIYCRYSVAGIVTCLRSGTISDCLSDFPGYFDAAYGICRFVSGVSVNNCLNITTNKDFAADSEDNWEGFSGSNNYSLTTAEDAELAKHITKTKVDELASGEICLKLGENWEQNIGTDAYPTPTGKRGVYHMRDVYKKEYGTICVPFPLETLKGVGVGQREYYLFDEVKNEADGTVSICFKYTDVVPAGTPAIFRAYVYSDYYFLPMEKEYQFEVQPTVGTEWTFNGTFEQKVFEGEDAKSIYYLDGTVDKSAIKNAKKTTIAPYRAYFQGPDINDLTAAGAKSIKFVIEDEDGETTEIKLADFNENQNFNFNGNFNGKTYSIMGTQVNENYRGIVIKNGKKILKK